MPLDELDRDQSNDFNILPIAEYFPAVLQDIASAEKYIFVKVPTWRNDEAGKDFAQAILGAARRGVKVFIANDTRGDFFEYAEGNGQAFFHDNPSLYRIFQARLMARLYGHHPAHPQKNDARDELMNHPNIEVIDDVAIHDHSKVIVIDGQIGYVGGANIGNDFHPSYGSNDARMVDYMGRLQGEEAIQDLLRACLGEKEGSNQDGSLQFIHNNTVEKGQRGFLDFVKSAQGGLVVGMAFHTKPEYIEAITNLVQNEQPVTLMTPRSPTTRHYGNKVFLSKLVSTTRGFHDFLTIAVHPSRVHAKVAHDDERAFVGSQNWTMDGYVAETSVLARGKGHRDNLASQLAQEISKCRSYTGQSLREIEVITSGERALARMEDLIVGVDTHRSFAHAAEITSAREKCHAKIRALLAQFP